MNKKIITLKKKYEFTKVLDKGKYYIKNQIIVYIKPNNKNKNYIGIAISKHLCHAVKRNRLKRLIRENYRIINNQFNLKEGFDIVFLWNKKTNIEEANFNIIKKDMMDCFNQAEILEEK